MLEILDTVVVCVFWVVAVAASVLIIVIVWHMFAFQCESRVAPTVMTCLMCFFIACVIYYAWRGESQRHEGPRYKPYIQRVEVTHR